MISHVIAKIAINAKIATIEKARCFQIMAILALMAILAISPFFLIHNMHVHRRGMAQEALNGIQVEILLPAPDG